MPPLLQSIKSAPSTLREASRTHTPWLWPTEQTLTKCQALLLVLLLWFGYWGDGTTTAIAYLSDRRDMVNRTSWGWATVTIRKTGTAVLLVLAVAFAIHATAPRPTGNETPSDPLRPPRNRKLSPLVTALTILATWLGFKAQTLVNGALNRPDKTPSYAYDTLSYQVSDTISVALAGPAEEIFFGLAVLTLLRRAHFGWTSAIALSLLLRTAFHIYYDVGVLALTLVWGGALLLMYVATGRWLAMAVGHTLWNITASPLLPADLQNGHLRNWALLLALLPVASHLALRDEARTKADHIPHR